MSSFPPEWETLQAAMRADVNTQIATLLATVEALNAITATANATINANPAAAIKDLTREVKTVARQLVRVSRLIVAAFDTGDTGT